MYNKRILESKTLAVSAKNILPTDSPINKKKVINIPKHMYFKFSYNAFSTRNCCKTGSAIFYVQSFRMSHTQPTLPRIQADQVKCDI